MAVGVIGMLGKHAQRLVTKGVSGEGELAIIQSHLMGDRDVWVIVTNIRTAIIRDALGQ